LAPAPFALYVPRSSGTGDCGDAPADCRDEVKPLGPIATTKRKVGPEQYLFAIVFCFNGFVPSMNTGESQVPETPITKPGDLVILGENRLLVGDSRNPDDAARLMNGEKVLRGSKRQARDT
jgi:hypothetical protein